MKLFLFNLSLAAILFINISCEGKRSSSNKIENFKKYYSLVQKNSDRKWIYMQDTVKWYFKENRDNPAYLYKGKKKTGRWAEWDKEMNPEYSYDSIWFNANKNAIEGFFLEDNDFYNLIGKGPTRTLQTFWLDDQGKIKEIMVYWIPEENTLTKVYLKPVQEWAKIHDSALIKEIYPDGTIVPSKVNAIKWKKLLNRYNQFNSMKFFNAD